MDTPFRKRTGVFTDKNVLKQQYEPEEILERDEEIEAYANALQDVVDGWEPENVFVYGKTGVGKTAVTRYMMDMLRVEADQRPDVDDVHVAEVNCHHHPSSYQAAIALVNELRADTEREAITTGLSTSDVLTALFEEIEDREGTVLVVLDEIDNLGDDDVLLYQLPRAKANGNIEHSQVGVIGISNDYTFRNDLSSKVQDTLCEREIKFPPYDANELRTILSDRAEKGLSSGVLDDSVIPKCAALAAQDRGSARQAIDLLREAANVAVEDGCETVAEADVDAAENRVERGRVKDSIRDLTTHGRYTLLAVTNLAIEAETPVRAKEAYGMYERVCAESGADPLSQRSVHDHLIDLAMLGFLAQYDRNHGRGGGQYYEYELDVEPGIVTSVLGAEE
ncbi:orc1/cdc6 family replication initiation protein [Halarchaeum nitratireducens]|uniref:ORC1-type DNA replication protein n=1 Tax=Halarchaeum nitratireducens TaxID=489913 RepID=A0A830GA39_9EURY|nr:MULTISPECIES: orc1/cdc6 family replication initiation protein [Halarchaeum]MBP2250642.1 cell division control protein 6 [Halarchaeum solikamskense]GGN15852.1 cell division control protein Cdc6 [Halarchaeum nitratireducens]